MMSRDRTLLDLAAIFRGLASESRAFNFRMDELTTEVSRIAALHKQARRIGAKAPAGPPRVLPSAPPLDEPDNYDNDFQGDLNLPLTVAANPPPTEWERKAWETKVKLKFASDPKNMERFRKAPSKESLDGLTLQSNFSKEIFSALLVYKLSIQAGRSPGVKKDAAPPASTSKEDIVRYYEETDPTFAIFTPFIWQTDDPYDRPYNGPWLRPRNFGAIKLRQALFVEFFDRGMMDYLNWFLAEAAGKRGPLTPPEAGEAALSAWKSKRGLVRHFFGDVGSLQDFYYLIGENFALAPEELLYPIRVEIEGDVENPLPAPLSRRLMLSLGP